MSYFSQKDSFSVKKTSYLFRIFKAWCDECVLKIQRKDIFDQEEVMRTERQIHISDLNVGVPHMAHLTEIHHAKYKGLVHMPVHEFANCCLAFTKIFSCSFNCFN